jgi:hypothetical protein
MLHWYCKDLIKRGENMAIKTIEEKYDTITSSRIRDKDRLIIASRKTDLLREKLSAKIKNTDSAKLIRKWRDSR